MHVLMCVCYFLSESNKEGLLISEILKKINKQLLNLIIMYKFFQPASTIPDFLFLFLKYHKLSKTHCYLHLICSQMVNVQENSKHQK